MISFLTARSRLVRELRTGLDTAGLMEVETPVRIAAPALERHIDALPSGRNWLRTSPELHMKRLLVAGMTGIYQIGPCFRSDERGDRHNPEFTLLEWYRTSADYRTILDDARDLLKRVCRIPTLNLPLPNSAHLPASDIPWEIIPVREAFRRWAGWDPVDHWDADRFNQDMAFCIEPALPPDRPVVLIDYPAAVAALARLSPGDERIAERWELYCGGLELCNAFSELTDPTEQRRRFEECRRARAHDGAPDYPLDEAFLSALENGLPPSGGAALGVDRLCMLLCGTQQIHNVRVFCDEIPL